MQIQLSGQSKQFFRLDLFQQDQVHYLRMYNVII